MPSDMSDPATTSSLPADVLSTATLRDELVRFGQQLRNEITRDLRDSLKELGPRDQASLKPTGRRSSVRASDDVAQELRHASSDLGNKSYKSLRTSLRLGESIDPHGSPAKASANRGAVPSLNLSLSHRLSSPQGLPSPHPSQPPSPPESGREARQIPLSSGPLSSLSSTIYESYSPLLRCETSDVSKADGIVNAIPVCNVEQLQCEEGFAPRNALERFVLSSHYDVVTAIFIMGYLVWVAVETDASARYWTREPFGATRIEETMCAVFIADITLRIYSHGFLYFQFCWNWVDLVLVFIQVQSIVFPHSVARSLLIFRVVRVWRVIKTFRMFEQLRASVISIIEAIGEVMWLMVFLVLVVLSFSIVITQSVTEFKLSLEGEEKEGNEDLEMMEERFGTLPRSMLLMYMTISEGIHWGEASEPLARYCSPVFDIVFSMYMTFVLFAVMNVVTASFIQTADKVSLQEKNRHLSEALFDSFRESDGTPMAGIDREKFDSAMDTPLMKHFLDRLEIDEETAREHNLFSIVDVNQDQSVDADELVKICVRLTGGAKSFDVARLQRELSIDTQLQDKHNDAVEKALAAIAKALALPEFDDDEQLVENGARPIGSPVRRFDAPSSIDAPESRVMSATRFAR